MVSGQAAARAAVRLLGGVTVTCAEHVLADSLRHELSGSAPASRHGALRSPRTTVKVTGHPHSGLGPLLADGGRIRPCRLPFTAHDAVADLHPPDSAGLCFMDLVTISRPASGLPAAPSSPNHAGRALGHQVQTGLGRQVAGTPLRASTEVAAAASRRWRSVTLHRAPRRSRTRQWVATRQQKHCRTLPSPARCVGVDLSQRSTTLTPMRL